MKPRIFWPRERGTLDYRKLLDKDDADRARFVRENRIMSRHNLLSTSVKRGVDEWMIGYTPSRRISLVLMLVIALLLLLASITAGIMLGL